MVAGGTIKDCMIILPQGGLFVMYEEQEAQALKQALESVDFCVDGKHCELLAKVTGQKLDKDFLKLIFADTLRQDLRLDNADIADKICPPANGDWQRILADKPELSAMVDESIQAAFRFGYYYAMQESGVNWQPCEKLAPIDGEKVVSPLHDLPIEKEDLEAMQDGNKWDLTDSKTIYLEGKAVELWEYLYPESYAHAKELAKKSITDGLDTAGRQKAVKEAMIAELRKDKAFYNKLMVKADKDLKTIY
jgi:hypothetical protein